MICITIVEGILIQIAVTMSTSSCSIPIIDVDRIGLHRKSQDIDRDVLEDVGSKMKDALSKFGVCYFKNHGIDQDFIEKYLSVAEDFFKQANETKMQYVRGSVWQFGYYPCEHENLNTERPGDLKESFNYHPADDQADWTNIEFHRGCKELFALCKKFGNTVLDALSVGLGLKQSFLRDSHKYIGQMDNLSALRTLYYPPIPLDVSIKLDQVRLGEHSDYGTVSLLFQDEVGGLEVNMPGKGLIPVTPIPGTIVILAGDLLQRWTSGSLFALKHMVHLPEEESKRRNPRQSAVFFIMPDNDCLVKPLDGSEMYPSVRCIDHVNAKLKPRAGVTY